MFHNSDVYIKIDLKMILSKAKYSPIPGLGRAGHMTLVCDFRIDKKLIPAGTLWGSEKISKTTMFLSFASLKNDTKHYGVSKASWCSWLIQRQISWSYLGLYPSVEHSQGRAFCLLPSAPACILYCWHKTPALCQRSPRRESTSVQIKHLCSPPKPLLHFMIISGTCCHTQM